MRGDGANPIPPIFFATHLYKWLDAALDVGVSEFDFWEMTPAELIRMMESKKRVIKNEAIEKAISNYRLADLIGRSVSRIYSTSNRMPELYEIYPHLFDSEEIEEAKQKNRDEASAARLKQFASSFNKKYKREVSKSNG